MEQPRLVDVAPVACADLHCEAPAETRDRLGFLVCAVHARPPAPWVEISEYVQGVGR